MTDVTFRTAVVETSEPVIDPKVKVDHDSYVKSEVEVPFSMFRNENKIPFTAKYMDTPLTWEAQDMVGDITAIEDYLKELVGKGELEDSTKAAKLKLISLEKMIGTVDDKEPDGYLMKSKAQRIARLAKFCNYLYTI